MTGVQLFGVTAAQGWRGRLAAGCSFVAFRDLAAVVADAPYAAPAPDALDRYRTVVESVFRAQAVIPAPPPGVVFRSRDLLTQWLELHYFTLLEGLEFVEDRVAARVSVVPAPGAAEAAPEPADAMPDALLRDALLVLRRHAVATLTAGTDGDGTPPAASFLVERARWDVFLDLVAGESQRLEGASLRWSGPWPPYDFVRMQFAN